MSTIAKKTTSLFIAICALSTLFAQDDANKHEKYGTTEQIRKAVPSFLHQDYAPNSRSTDVTITCDGGSWQSEVSWEILNDAGTVVVSGGAPYADAASLDDGTYTVNGADAYGDGWNGNYLIVTDATSGTEYLNWTVEGSSGTTTFEIGATEIVGCMTADACNYNPDATVDDGSCCLTNCTDVAVGGGDYMSEVSWEIIDDDAMTVASGNAPYDGFWCFEDGDYTVAGYDSYGDGWNGNVLTITDYDGNVVVSFTLEAGDFATTTFSLPYQEPVDLVDVFFSEYAEGSSSNKYLEVYNGTGAAISLDDFVILGNYNGNPWSEAFTFAAGATLDSADVYVIANADADSAILAEADEILAYGDPWYTAAFNGDDVRALASATDPENNILDIIGTLDGDGDGVEGEGAEDDPGSGFDVAGVTNGTKDYTLVRKDEVTEGNGGDWAASAGTDEWNSEWSVEERPTADYTPPTLGWHINEPNPPCEDTELTINMYDSYGDGWNGNILMIGDLSYTVETGDFESAAACLMDGSYSVTCDGGSYPSEVSWEIVDNATGETLLAGGAPYSGVLQIGETNDVLGCMDPSAVNYNPDATVDDGSCYYAGDSCNIALDFIAEGGAIDGSVPVTGAIEYSGDADWYYFVLDEAWDYLLISLIGSDFDTKLEVWDECDDASWVAYNDDANGTLQSEVLMPNVTAGDGYVKVYGYGASVGNYVLTIEAYNNPTSPSNLTAEGSLELISLAWDPYVPAGRSGSMVVLGDIPSNITADNEVYTAKREEYNENQEEARRFRSAVNENYAPNSRSTDVTITCDGGSWQSEVSWNIMDDAGTIVAEGGAPFSGDASLDDGTYTVNGYDAYGDGWNGNYLIVTGTDGTGYLNWTIESGSEGSTTFEISSSAVYGCIDPDALNYGYNCAGENVGAPTLDDGCCTYPAPDLSLTDIWYDYEADAVMVTALNGSGTDVAAGFYITFYLLNATNGECGNYDYEAYVYVSTGLAAGESLDTGVGPGLLSYLGGYGDYNFGAMVDYLCQIEESDETNNTYEEDITLTDPLAGTTWNVYRSDGGAAFAQVGTAETDPFYADPFPGTDGSTEYCYYVTQIMDDATESSSSNEACATPIAPVALPTPTELVGEADGWQVNLSWTAPDLSNYDPGMAQSFSGDKEDDPSTYINYDPSDYPDMTRQGGDTDADATVVDGLPYNDTGTTDGYTDDYDEACPYTGSTSPDVVYSFTSDADVIMSVDLCSDGNQYDTKTYVYENAMGTLAGTVSLGANSACNDDFCSNAYTSWASFIGDVIVTAGNTYYIVIDGYGGGSGNYDLTLADATPSPVLSYNVYRDGVGVGSSDGVSNTEWSEFLVETGTYDYSVTAVYDIYGESGPSNTVSVEVAGEAPACNAPQNLMATVEDNDVSLMWEAPEGGEDSAVITYFNGTYFTNVGTNGAATFEAAVIFTPEQLQSYDGMSLTTVSFIPGEVDAVYTVMIYDVSSGTPVAVDSSGAYSGADLVIGEFNDVDLANPITIDWTQNLSFGYKCVTNAGYPLGCDDGPATPGYSDLLNFGGWVSMADAYGLNYNWAISGEVNNAANSRSLSSMDPIDVNYPNIQTGEPSARTLPVPIPIEINTSSTRDLVEYNVYRNAEQIGTSTELEYSDMDVAIGVHTYFVTALYDNSEDCGESEPSNEVEVEVFDTGDMVTITIDLYDSYGDGWNGGNLNVAGSDYTIDAGDVAQFFMDLAEGTHSWYYTPGSWPEENSWVVSSDGNILFEGTGPDEQGGTFTVGGGPEITAIYDIQYSTDAENGYPSPLIGQEVSIVGVVTAVKYNGINVQESYGEWRGIWVYSGTGSTDYINVGDLYQVTGTVDEYNLLTELVCGAEDLTYLGSDYYVEPVMLESTNSANDEALEGVFVNVSGECIDDDVSDYGQWAIDDGTGPVQVEDHYVSYQPILGYSYDLMGPMGHSSYDTTYEIGPSDSASIVETPPCEGIQAGIICDYGSYQSEVSWVLTDNGTGEAVTAGIAPDYQDVCMYDGSYTLDMFDTYGDGWNGNMWELWVDDSLVFSTTLESGDYGQASFIFGETDDVLGCTDPAAVNYDPNATLDDGSCYYAGDSCSIALDAVVGLNPATGADQWFSYTATMNGSILATTCYEGQCEDTKVEVYSACPEDGGTIIAESDDAMCMDATGCTNYASEVEFDCVAGVTYYFFWDDFWGPGAYEWLLDESPPPSSPQDLVATADLELVTLTWEGLNPNGRSGNSFQGSPAGSNIVDDYNQSLEKKENNANRTPIRSVTLDKVYSYAQLTGRNNASRDASVIMTLYDSYGDGYDGTGYITDTSGTTVYAEFPGGWTGYESAYGPYDLADGLYMVWFEEASWAYETTWELTDASDSTAVIASGSVESPGYFAIGENAPMANLSFTDIWYDHEGDAVVTELINDGDMDAGGFYVVYYLTYATNDTCGNAYYDGYTWVDGIPQGGTAVVALGPGILDYVGGYGTYTFGAFADYLCAVSETDETDNTIEETMTLSDPNEGIVWNIYRSDDGADFAMLGTAETDPTYADPFPGTDGLTEYCYYVTQIMADEMESDTSNHACASPVAPVDLPIPTDLVGEADGWQVNLSWTPPDLSGFDPGMAQSFEGDKEDDPSMYINYDPSDYPDMTRQGGDTDADATVVDGLPYSDTGTTLGYTDDYDEVCPYTGSTSPDVVYSFTPDADGIMSVDLCSDGNFYDTKTYVYENDMGNLAGTVALGPNSACNDDFCANANTSWASFIGDVIITAGNTYYIVIDGYGGDAGDYDLLLNEVAPPSPLLSYNVYRDDVIVGNADGDADQYTEFVTEVGTYDYFVTAVYDIYGESNPSNTVSVEVEGAAPTCNAPQNLTAESMGNDVSLSWEAPAGGSGWLHHDNGESTNSIGTGAAAEFSVAARFGPEHLMDYNGMSLTQIQFVHAVAEASYQVVVWTAEVGGAPNVISETDWIPGTDLPVGEWNMVDLTEAITIDWSQELWFGYNINTPSGYPAGCDSGPMVPGYGAKILWGGEWFDLTDLNAALDYNWSIQGFVDSSPGRSIASLGTIDSPTVGLDPDAEFNAQRFPEPIEVTIPLSRSLVNYRIYRDGEYFMSTTPEMTAYDDMDVPWGSHTYFVTANYDDSEACGESDPSNEVEVYLENGAPLGFSLISPPDGFELFVNEDNQDEQVAFIWTASADPDNDLVQYFLVSDGVVGEDTVENVYPGNELGNSGFEDGSNENANYPVGWDLYPDNVNHLVFETGWDMYGDPPYTFEAYEGDHSLLIWGLYNGVQGNENNVFQTWSDGSLEPGTEFSVNAWMMTNEYNSLSQGGNYAVLFAKYFGAGWSWIGMETSAAFDGTYSDNDWHNFQFDATVPDGAEIVQVGVMIVQADDNSHGTVYVDAFHMHMPMLQTGLFIPYGEMAEDALEDTVSTVVYLWDVWAWDGWDGTPSNDGPRTLTVDVSALLGIDGDGYTPDVFALHNNYPNPFNPITNITYDIPEVSDVTLDVFNVAGQKVRTLVQKTHEPGRYRVVWGATNDYGQTLSSGMYFYRIQAGDFVSVKKLILMK